MELSLHFIFRSLGIDSPTYSINFKFEYKFKPGNMNFSLFFFFFYLNQGNEI